jgi:predicted RNA-binding protein
MKRIVRFAHVVVLPLMVTLGCEHIALMPRPYIDRRDGDPSELSRPDLGGGEVARIPEAPGGIRERDTTGPREEVVGTVERIDTNRREIHLRTTEARMITIKYDPDISVRGREREFRVDFLRRGDLILVQVSRNSRGERYADLIRLNDRQELGSRGY